MKERDVMQYGTLEEFVTSSCETAPGLLTHRHQAKLGLGLRARVGGTIMGKLGEEGCVGVGCMVILLHLMRTQLSMLCIGLF